MAKITKTTVDRLRPKRREDGSEADGYLWDETMKGFGVKATPGGRKIYLVQYRLNGRAGKTQRVTIGTHGRITPDQARKLAAAILARITTGEDPAANKREARRKAKDAVTFAVAMEHYLELNGGGNSSWEETARLLRFDAVPVLGQKNIDAVTRADVGGLIATVTRRSPSVARALFAALRPAFPWWLDNGYIDKNPIADMKPPPAPKARDRVLTDAEIRAFWTATERLGWPFGPCCRLMFLTAQRREEVGAMEWSELDRSMSAWTLPGGRAKNGKEHAVDVSPQARAILEGLPRTPCEAGRSFVFTMTGRTSLSGWSKAKARLDGLMRGLLDKELWTKFQDAGADDEAARKLGFGGAEMLETFILPPWRLHDLRRTAATGMAGLGVPPHVVERVLNHVSGAQGGLVAVYQHHEYRPERKDALLKWGRFVEDLVTDKTAPE